MNYFLMIIIQGYRSNLIIIIGDVQNNYYAINNLIKYNYCYKTRNKLMKYKKELKE